MIFIKKKGKLEKKDIDITVNDVTNTNNGYNDLKDYFNKIIGNMIDFTVRLKESSISDLINNFISQIHDSIKNIITNMVFVSGIAFNLEKSVDNLKKTLSVQGARIDKILKLTSNMSLDITDISAKTKRLKNNTVDAMKSSHIGVERVEEFITDLKSVENEIIDTKLLMKSLKDSADAINGLTSLIEDITSKLDIISINTSIEAARAGSAGSGFKVLAKEIRKLASQSDNAVHDVNNIITTTIDNISNVEKSLVNADEKVVSCITVSKNVKNDFYNINDLNNKINDEATDISSLLDSQEKSAFEIKKSTEVLKKSGAPINELAESTDAMSKELHNSVDSVLENSKFKLDWHKKAIDYMYSLKSEIEGLNIGEIENYFTKELESNSFVELFYAMNISGIQITDNIVNKKYPKIIKTGKGIDRTSKDYVSSILKGNESLYLSNIYVSTASRDLCVTVSIIAQTFTEQFIILAADINIKDFINL